VGDYYKRTHKLFESANIKIDSVVSDLFGATNRNLMNLLVSDRKSLTFGGYSDLCPWQTQGQRGKVIPVHTEFFSDHHRFILQRLLETIAMLEAEIEIFDSHIRHAMKD